MSNPKTTVVFIPALLCDATLYNGVIERLGDQIEAHVMMSPKPTMAASVADILARAPKTFALVGTSYAGNLALEIAIAAPERVTALWLMGCDAAAPQAGGPDLAGGLSTQPEAVIDMLGTVIAHPDNKDAAATFKTMAHRVGGQAGAAQATALATRQESLTRLRGLAIPALVLWGADDALVPVAAGKTLAQNLPHAHFHALPHCGHLPTLEAPAAAADLFAKFLMEETAHHA